MNINGINIVRRCIRGIEDVMIDIYLCNNPLAWHHQSKTLIIRIPQHKEMRGEKYLWRANDGTQSQPLPSLPL